MQPDPFETLTALVTPLLWFDQDGDLLGKPARPLSLGSRQAVDVMGLRVLRADPGYDSIEAELADLYAYAWLHTAELPHVCAALWSGGWRAMMEAGSEDENVMATATAVLPEWRQQRMTLAASVKAVEYRVVARPRSESAGRSATPQPPADLMHPLRLSHRLRLLMRETGAPRMEALWQWPYVQALMITHAAERWEAMWTVPEVERTGPADFEGFELGGEGAEIGGQRSEVGDQTGAGADL